MTAENFRSVGPVKRFSADHVELRNARDDETETYMSRRNIALALAMLLSLSLNVAVEASDKENQSAPAQPVTVVIDSRPEHAEIRLNGQFVGTTPLSYPLQAGDHRIELVRRNYEPWRRTLTVAATPTRVVAILDQSQSTKCAER